MIFKELKGKKSKELSILKLFIIANNQELGNRFLSFTAKTRMDTFTNFCLYLCFYSYVLAKSRGKIPNFYISLCLYSFYGTICAEV